MHEAGPGEEKLRGRSGDIWCGATALAPLGTRGRRKNREGSFSAACENRVFCTSGLEGLLVGRKMTLDWDDCVVASYCSLSSVVSDTASIIHNCPAYYVDYSY